MSRMAGFLFAGLFLAMAVSWAGAATASAAEPIEGDWQYAVSGGNVVVRVSATSPGHFQGVVVSIDPGANCARASQPGTVKWRQMTGSGNSYSGKLPFYRTDTCAEVGDGDTTWTLSDNDHGTIQTRNPTNGQSGGGPFTRYQPPPAKVTGALPVLVNGVLLDLQASYRRLSGASKKRKVALFRGMAQRANKGLDQVTNYDASSSEKTLKTCANKAIARALGGARARSRGGLGAGMLAIATCLKPFKVLFPDGKPGAQPPPKNQPQRGATADFVGVGTDPNLIPRVEFSYDLAANQNPPPVINLHLSLRVACLSRGVFYLVLDSRSFGPLARYTDASGHFNSFGGTTYVQGLKVDFAAQIEAGGGVHGTLHAEVDRNSSTDICRSSNSKRWYARRVS